MSNKSPMNDLESRLHPDSVAIAKFLLEFGEKTKTEKGEIKFYYELSIEEQISATKLINGHRNDRKTEFKVSKVSISRKVQLNLVYDSNKNVSLRTIVEATESTPGFKAFRKRINGGIGRIYFDGSSF